MRVVLTHIAASTHLNLMVPIGWALKNAGHEVVVAAQPDIMHAVDRTGLTGVAVGGPARLAERLAELAPEETIYGSGFRLAESRPEVLTYEYVRDCLAAWASPLSLDGTVEDHMYDGLVDFCRSWRPDLVIWDTLTFPGAVAARACGAAHVRTTISRDHWVRMRELYLRMRAERPEAADEADPVVEWISAKLRRFGCDFHEDVIFGQATIDSLPPWLRIPAEHRYIDMRYVAHNGPGALPAWLAEEEPKVPRVCLTKGFSTSEVMGDRTTFGLDDFFEAVADMPIEVIALMDPAALPEGATVPDNVRLPGFVPLDFLLKTCAAIIHHGGTGTVATSLSNGIPQIVIPHDLIDEDQVADQIAARGAGVHLDPGTLTADLLRTELTRVLEDPSFRENAAQIAKEMRELPGPEDLVRELEALVARHQASSGATTRS
ncbi:activator-dependent family glycosyltransferase [Marinactinospora thermotolerans]|uniref:Glycosyltransferase, activator-dependent family n=1 Tax=Marinactinospora thermotolerans DSM 45154 TaxID=1122192 RepID=A0A1T4R055_9ACTN|nr:activator-dependent family glycosyltransferase [Marinactinospora thermotolerans]SKA09275.1 glycosyltransferase, activator-dependent family [Marinactinospora thermotolerans DSM 45154]